MIQPKIKCNCCNGTGDGVLPKALKKTYAMISKHLEDSEFITASQLSDKSELELSLAHHHIKRLVDRGVLRKVRGSAPARYVTV
jgi:ribosomal protein S25